MENKLSNEVLEGNKLIAEFMERKIVDSPWSHKPLEQQGQWVYVLGQDFFKERIKYHYSWDWLMPVVEKIESIQNSDNYEVDIFGKCCEIGVMDEHSAVGKTKIEATWLAIVEFIKWYNP